MILSRVFILSILILSTSFSIKAQNLEYARFVLDELCSKDMEGRGYVNRGDKLAAIFVAKQFEKFGLLKFDNSYYQNYLVDINTFPGKMTLKINDKVLVPGRDYVVDPCMRGMSGSFETYDMKSHVAIMPRAMAQLVTADEMRGKFLILDKTKINFEQTDAEANYKSSMGLFKAADGTQPAGMIMLVDELLAWGTSMDECGKPLIMVRKSAVSGNIKKVQVAIESEYITDFFSQNVLAYVKGKTNPQKCIVISANYDHLGRMGQSTYFPGANENASGMAMMLDMARHYSQAVNQPDYTIVFMAFGATELGFLGSQFFVDNPLFPLNSIRFMINLDGIGTGEGGLGVVNGTEYKTEFSSLADLNTQKNFFSEIERKSESRSSDHYYFHKAGIPSFYIYTKGGTVRTNCVEDKPENLPFTKYNALFELLSLFITKL